jgi:hypothetical protein
MVSAVIEDISVIGFVNFAIRVANQDVVFTHVGPVSTCIWGRKIESPQII